MHALHNINHILFSFIFVPFSVANPALISVWVVQGHRPDVSVIPSDAPTELIEIIKDSWVGEPKERPSFKGKLYIHIDAPNELTEGQLGL